MSVKATLQNTVKKRNADLAKRNKELDDIKARLEALEKLNETTDDEKELEKASQELDELKAKKAELEAEKAELEAEIEELNAQIAELDKPAEEQPQRNRFGFMNKESRGVNKMTIEERNKRAADFVKTRATKFDNEELRSVLVSSGNLATPTGVDGINDNNFPKVSSFLDLVKVENCAGMGSNKIAYVDSDPTAAAHTEGGAITESDPTFKFVEIKPATYAVLTAISKEAKKQTNLQYESKVRDLALTALRQKAASVVTTAVVNSKLTKAVPLTALDHTALRKIAFAYGGNKGIAGAAWLALTKEDLITLGDVRGSNEKKAVFEIIPDSANPNTGVIKDGGLVVNYCLDDTLTKGTLLYGNPKNVELDLFSDYNVEVSSDFYFNKLMDAIRGDVELGADVVAKDGMLKVTVTPAA